MGRPITAISPTVPRLFTGQGPIAPAANIACLLLAGLLGSTLLHLAAYHLRADSTGGYLLAHCPWRPVLLIILLVALFHALVFWRELRALLRERRRLAARLQLQAAKDVLPRSPARLAVLFLCLYATQLLTMALAMHVAPMRAPMLMGGHTMLMAVTPLFPLPVGQVVVAGLLALLLWRFEHRVSVLRRVVCLLRRLVALLLPPPALAAPAPVVAGCAPRLLYGFAILARPPPGRCLRD